jgi:hypothetical protein
VANAQFCVVKMVSKERGVRAPIALVAWAFASEETDRRLVEQASGRRARLRPSKRRRYCFKGPNDTYVVTIREDGSVIS